MFAFPNSPNICQTLFLYASIKFYSITRRLNHVAYLQVELSQIKRQLDYSYSSY